jgi:hypothetical protein
MAIGTSSVGVTFSSGLPSASYQVSVNVTSGNGHAPNNNCRYWNVASKSTAGFTVERRVCNNGNLEAVDESAVLDWIAIQTQ